MTGDLWNDVGNASYALCKRIKVDPYLKQTLDTSAPGKQISPH